MDTKIQFRVDEETKQLATEQKQNLSHNAWLTEQVNQAFRKYSLKPTLKADQVSTKH